MNEMPGNHGARLDKREAERLLEHWLGTPERCISIRELDGGMVNRVFLLDFASAPKRAVLKVAAEAGRNSFAGEFQMLSRLRKQTRLPVPEPYLAGPGGAIIPAGFILMEYLPGVNLAAARLDGPGRLKVERQMAELLVDLHSHHRPYFGGLADPSGPVSWVEIFQPAITREFRAVSDRLSHGSCRQIERILESLPRLFADQGPPTLVHGDIWATNVIVSGTGDQARISGFIDPAARFADVEYELAYLEVFHTVSDNFFRYYTRHIPLRPGYELRRACYWLNTMMLHVRLFGDAHYRRATERIADRLTSGLLSG